MKFQTKISSLGWLCVMHPIDHWIPVFKCTDEQIQAVLDTNWGPFATERTETNGELEQK
jgi:hypothetical protein